MISIISCLLIVVIFILTGLFYGHLFTKVYETDKFGLISGTGLGIILGIFDFCVVAIIGALFKLSLMMCGYIWLIIVIVVGIIGLVKYGLPQLKNEKTEYVKKKDKGVIFLTALVLILIATQIIGVCIFSYNQPNATRMIPFATKACYENIALIDSPMMMLWAFLSRLVLMHPLTVIFTVSEVILIPVYYIIWWKISEELFSDRMPQLFMMLCLNVLNLWGYMSQHSIGATLLFSWFCGTAYIIYGLFPVVLWILLDKRAAIRNFVIKRKEKAGNTEYDEINDYYKWEEEDMKNHRIINARTVAVALLVVVILLVGSVYIMNKKINSLYSATVNLQEQINNGCSVYEFIPDENGTTAGYLLKQSDGAIVVIGGGAEDNALALYDFIAKYGTNVSTWYLYGLDEDNKGAYDSCLNMGISVDKVLVMNVEEISE